MDEKFGPYIPQQHLGSGGMANVWRSVQPSLNRIVAIKVLSPQFSLESLVLKRFRHEAQIAASLQHSNIVKVFEVSMDSPPYFMVLEYLSGGTLEQRLERERLSIAQAVGIVIPLASALEYVHQQGYVHRDVKPANIIFNADGMPILTDFGIARAGNMTVLTQHGMRLGSALYMSPEQAAGFTVAPASDIYSLCAILYQMLTGSPPFIDKDPMIIMKKIIHDPLISPRKLNPAIIPALEKVLIKGLEKKPELRIQSGGELILMLQQACQQQTATTPLKVSDTLHPILDKRRQIAIILCVTMLLILSAILLGYLLQWV